METAQKLNSVYVIITDKNPSYIYVGVTTDLYMRFIKHCSRSSKCWKLKKAIRKFGRDSFVMSVVKEFVEESDAYYFESELIKILRADGYLFYNLTKGGRGPSGRRVGVETRRKLSSSMKMLLMRKQDVSGDASTGHVLHASRQGVVAEGDYSVVAGQG